MFEDDGGEALNKEFIRVDDLQTVENKLFVKFCFSEEVRRYFNGDRLFLTFDQNIEKINKSILSIPALSVVAPVAWAVGADVYLDSTDACFLRSLKNVESQFIKWFPRFSFSTEIHVDHVVSDASSGKRVALLFSGGLDSLTSYLQHKEQKPVLISIWGVGVPISESRYWNLLKEKLQDFADQEGLRIHFVETNANELLNMELLDRNFLPAGFRPAGFNWNLAVSHGLIHVGVASPLLWPQFGTLLVASSDSNNIWAPDGSLLFGHADVSLGNTKVFYDNHELTRLEKVRILKSNPRYSDKLIVCTSTSKFSANPTAIPTLNCCECEKCLRTIAELALEGIDPARSFSLIKPEDAFKLIKARLRYGGLTPDQSLLLGEWKDMQNSVADILKNETGTGNEIQGAREFFEWFRTFNLEKPVSALYRKYPTIRECQVLARYKGSKDVILFLLWTLLQRIRRSTTRTDARIH